MKKAVILGQRQAGLIDVPDPQPVKDWVVVKVHASALCTEYKSYLVGRELELGGHEGVGEVVAMAQPGSVKIGDRVVILPQLPCGNCDLCRRGDCVYCEHSLDFEKVFGNKNGFGTFGQYVLKPDWMLPPIPENVSYEHATMAIDGIGASFGAFQAIDINAFDILLVTGLGPVGLGAVVNARFRGTRVIGVEPVPWRRERGLHMGAEAVFDPGDQDLVAKIHALTGGKGVTCAVDCSGNVQSQRLCIDATRRRGRVAFVGESQDALTIRISPDMIRKGLTIVGSWLYNVADFPKVMQVIQESPLIDLLISHVIPMSQIQDGFELLASGQCAKVVINPWR
ncbi:MAG TPA: zinc-binding dehydrogenase [Anaerolineales bacterium]|nr:zinc-binding dehydrogenase [Anaerolineales bacterium]